MKLISMSLVEAVLIFVSYAAATAAEPENSQPSSQQAEPESNQQQLEPIIVYGKADSNAFVTPLDVLAPSNQESYTKKCQDLWQARQYKRT
jgi:hypothetical protein